MIVLFSDCVVLWLDCMRERERGSCDCGDSWVDGYGYGYGDGDGDGDGKGDWCGNFRAEGLLG